MSLHFLEAPQRAPSVNFSTRPSTEISKDVAVPRVAQYGRNLRWARISAILCLSSSNFFLSWAMSERMKRGVGYGHITKSSKFTFLESFVPWQLSKALY